MQHRAIETRYKGYRFRSRLEARWAVFFDSLGVKWEYEPEGFELESGHYLPDFFLLELGLWVEVKPGKPPSTAESQRLEELCETTNCYGLIVWGLPDSKCYAAFHREGHLIDTSDEFSDMHAGIGVCSHLGVPATQHQRAAEVAKGARFEHGEKGGRA